MHRSRILVVEDSSIDQIIVRAALEENHAITIAPTITDAEKVINQESFDLILLDINLPDGNGFDFLKKLQEDEDTRALPVIFYSSSASTVEEVNGLSLGAEDYIAKPTDPLKLRARIEARLRKIKCSKAQSAIIKNRELKVNLTLQSVHLVREGVEVSLDFTPIELKLLAHFLGHEGRVISRNQLIKEVWPSGISVNARTVDMHVSNLRRKISASLYTISSIRGTGYRFMIAEKKSGKARKKKQ